MLVMEQTEVSEKNSIRSPYKSWGEEQIARLLDRNRITYQYEYPVAVVDRGKTRIYYPDFRLPEYGLILVMTNGEGIKSRFTKRLGLVGYF